jgi:hypothetical protein
MLGHEPRLGAALHREIAVGSPDLERITGEGGEIDERSGALIGKAEAIIEESGAEADGDRQAIRTLAEGLAGVGRGLVRCGIIRQRQASCKQVDRSLLVPQERDQLRPGRPRDEIEGGQLQVLRRIREDAGLMHAEGFDDAVRVAGGARSRAGAVEQLGRLGEQNGGTAGDGGGDQAAAGDVRDVHGRPQVD